MGRGQETGSKGGEGLPVAGTSSRVSEAEAEAESEDAGRATDAGAEGVSEETIPLGPGSEGGEGIEGADEDEEGRKNAGFNLSTVTLTGFLFFKMVKTLAERCSTTKGPS